MDNTNKHGEPMNSHPGGDWSAYYRSVSGRPPRELLRHALRLFPPAPAGSRLALDIGCGTGNETLELLRQGWRVLAIDEQPSALEALRSAVSPADVGRLQIHSGSVTDLRLPEADLVWAGRSLPFLEPGAFPNVWNRIVEALKPGARFAGDFFGTRHIWTAEKHMNFHTARQVKALFKPLRIEYFMTEYGLKPTATQGIQRTHAFAVIATRTP